LSVGFFGGAFIKRMNFRLSAQLESDFLQQLQR
jgi:hypothetical protein